jgi:hypothetical protein
MNRRTLSLLLVSSLLLGSSIVVGCSRSSGPSNPAPQHSSADLRKLTVNQVEERIHATEGIKPVIYDCNSKEQFAGAHLPGARWVVFNGVTAADLPPDKATPLIFYCRNEA